MNTPTFIVISVVAFIIVIALFLAVLAGFLRKLMKKAEQKAITLWETEGVLRVEKSANFFGVESRGMGQVRGNSVLMLTGKGLRNMMWLPSREFGVDWETVRKVEIVKSHLGKSKLAPLVKVHFTNEKGESDSAAWLVKDTSGIIDDISARITA